MILLRSPVFREDLDGNFPLTLHMSNSSRYKLVKAREKNLRCFKTNLTRAFGGRTPPSSVKMKSTSFLSQTLCYSIPISLCCTKICDRISNEVNNIEILERFKEISNFQEVPLIFRNSYSLTSLLFYLL